MMTSQQIRQSFLDFFKSKQHTIVPSSSLLPDSPGLLFTNAGMNQFVPIFLNQRKPDVSKWAGAIPGLDTRAADTQKCIRAGGKHNDLEDVGLDTYHHTFFEMLGNWSFGDYFKKEAIEWAWELVVETWKFPPTRLYATVYKPGPGDPAEFDQEACAHWERLFHAAGLDPKIHICTGGKKDNFWMMGDTGPCGPCSEIHVNLAPGPRDLDQAGQQAGARLVNQGDARCIEIWNLVFIQFNANPDGTFSPLPARHVDTGMGFERVTSIIQGTKGLTDFQHANISNYETDVFRPIFDALEKLSGKKYRSTLPGCEDAAVTKESGQGHSSVAVPLSSSARPVEQIQLDIAFRVIADHVRTLSFAIADGIQPSNEGRGYVLRRILRRAVRYGRTLGFHEPFFYKLVDVLADTMGDVFSEIRARKKHVQDVIRVEEEAFNKTLDRGIALFEEEVARLLGGARVPRVVSSVPAETRPTNIPTCIESAQGSRCSKRHIPHFERPWGKYMVTFTTVNHRQLSPKARDLVLESLLFTHRQGRWQLFAACVMPDHVHALFEPQIKEQDADGNPVFWSLTELLHSVKSFTAHEINKVEGTTGSVWEKESFDRLIRSDADLAEKFHYICRNPWDNGVVPTTEPYKWLWTPGDATVAHASGVPSSASMPTKASTQTAPSEKSVEQTARRDASQNTRDACAPPSQNTPEASTPQISGAFAFKLYDEQGFPLDLTELMARERGLTVDVEGFNKLMEEQRARARAAQKKEVISLSQIETTTPTKFVGYNTLETKAKVLEIVGLKDKTAVILDTSACYAEMGGQVGDTGEILLSPAAADVSRLKHADGADARPLLRVTNTQKSGNTWLHFVTGETLPGVGDEVLLRVDRPRRERIQRHHTVTHLLHWALHEVVSKDAAQKGSYVGPDKLTFDFNSAPLTPAQVADVEKLVNERIVENAGVSWTEVPYADVKSRKDVMQFFGEKYGDVVRVVQIGGQPGALDGYSLELCGGTHTRATGEIGLFRIAGESAIAAGVRRIEAVAGLTAYEMMRLERELIRSVAGKVNSPLHELEKRIENLLAQQKKLEKEVQIALQRNASNAASELLERVQTVNGIPLITHNLGDAAPEFLQATADALKGRFQGVVVLGGCGHNAVTLVATVSPEFTAKVQAGKLIQHIAPIVGGKGGGRPDVARGGGKDASKLDEALAKVRSLLD
jgi:alanyl-tRNA synthetase/REP element-mobilizing transposase RayT